MKTFPFLKSPKYVKTFPFLSPAASPLLSFSLSLSLATSHVHQLLLHGHWRPKLSDIIVFITCEWLISIENWKLEPNSLGMWPIFLFLSLSTDYTIKEVWRLCLVGIKWLKNWMDYYKIWMVWGSPPFHSISSLPFSTNLCFFFFSKILLEFCS